MHIKCCVRKREIYRDILNNVSVKSLKIIFFVEFYSQYWFHQ